MRNLDKIGQLKYSKHHQTMDDPWLTRFSTNNFLIGGALQPPQIQAYYFMVFMSIL